MVSSTHNYSVQVVHGDYYPHIDGIRALAVLPVVFFHILAVLCPGGFAGVDVFFVISGYLITGGILRDLEHSRFTVRNFYHRRIKRIMPAYFALIIGVFAVGCILYYAHPLIYLADATIMGTLFSSNFYFYLFSGDYFDLNNHNNALLHLWSLSVEEQFYLFIPILCATIWKLRRNWLFPALVILAILSFVGAVCAITIGKQNSAFYLLHFRAWELLAGSLLAMLAIKSRGKVPCSVQRGGHSVNLSLLATLGLIMVLIPYAALSSKTPFPGFSALSSVLGTTLLIRYGCLGWVSQLLSCSPFIFIGKISYSLYLWHWPVTVFWKYAVYDQLYWYDYVGMLLISFLLAYLSWRFVEMPVRTSKSWTMRRSFAFAVTGIIFLVSVGTVCICNKGWPKYLHPAANAMTSNEFPSRVNRMLMGIKTRLGAILGYESSESFRLQFGAHGDFKLGDPNKKPILLLLGDSHAGHLQHGMDKILRDKNLSGFSINRPSAAMFNLQHIESREALEKLVRMSEVSWVIIAERWIGHSTQLSKTNLDVKIEKFIVKLKAMGKRVVIITDIANYSYAPCDIAARLLIISPRWFNPEWDAHLQSEVVYNRSQGEINNKLQKICARTGAIFVPLHLAFKSDKNYIAFEKKDGHIIPLYKDEHHLSRAGSLRAAQFILPYLFSEKGDISTTKLHLGLNREKW